MPFPRRPFAKLRKEKKENKTSCLDKLRALAISQLNLRGEQIGGSKFFLG